MSVGIALVGAGLGGAGSIIRSLMSWVGLRAENPSLKWDWFIFVNSAWPGFATGVIAGALIESLDMGSVLSLVLSGAGASSIKSKVM